MNIPLQSIQDECNRVANIYRNRWRLKLQTAPMTDEGLSPLTYEKGIKGLIPRSNSLYHLLFKSIS